MCRCLIHFRNERLLGIEWISSYHIDLGECKVCFGELLFSTVGGLSYRLSSRCQLYQPASLFQCER